MPYFTARFTSTAKAPRNEAGHGDISRYLAETILHAQAEHLLHHRENPIQQQNHYNQHMTYLRLGNA